MITSGISCHLLSQTPDTANPLYSIMENFVHLIKRRPVTKYFMIILAMFICESSMSQELGFVIINRNLEIQEFDNYMLIDSTVSRDMLMNPVEIEIINENICEVFFGYHDGLFGGEMINVIFNSCLLYTSPSPRDATLSRMPSSA